MSHGAMIALHAAHAAAKSRERTELVAQRDRTISKSRRQAVIIGVILRVVLILVIGVLVALRSRG